MATRKRYFKQFKLQAVELLDQSDKPAADVAREMGVMRNQLYKRQHELRDKGKTRRFAGPAETPQRISAPKLRI